MSTLVTGGAGFIGRQVVERLHDGGERVVSYDRGPPAPGLPGDVARVRGELFDLRRLLATIGDHDVRRIVHAAGTSDPALSVCTASATVAANAAGTTHLLEAARLAELRGRVVLLSSTAVYGDNDDVIDERSPLSPRSPFAATKAFGDLLGEVYALRHGLDVISLRLSDVYGPGHALVGVAHEILDAACERRPLRLATGRDHAIHPLHVDDAARAIVAALEATEHRGGTYVVTGGERVTLGHLLALVRDRIPDADIALGPGELPSLERQGPLAIGAADRELGYRPRWGLARGIDDYIAWREASERYAA